MKKLLALLLAFIMAFSVTPVAFAAGENADSAAPVAAEAGDANTEAVDDTEAAALSDAPVFGDLRLTEQEINDFLTNPPPGVSAKLTFKLAKILFKLGVVFGKLHLTSLKVSNCYELAGTTGNSSINANVTTLKEATDNQIHDVTFWKDMLKLSDSL